MSLPGDVAHMKSGEEHIEKWEPVTQSYYRAGVFVFAASPGCAAGWQGQQQGLQIHCPSPILAFYSCSSLVAKHAVRTRRVDALMCSQD